MAHRLLIANNVPRALAQLMLSRAARSSNTRN